MITGIWRNLKIMCGNNHEEPQEMYVRQTDEDAFYCCPKYLPENRTPDEQPCMNRLSVYEIDKLLDNVAEEIQKEEDENGVAFIKNRRFHSKNVDYKILEYTDTDMVIEAMNKKARAD